MALGILHRWKTTIGIILLLTWIATYPFVVYYFADFYAASWKEYKEWYPRLYFLLFPAVKIFPFVVVGFSFYLLWDALLRIAQTIRRIPFQLWETLLSLKKIILRYAASVFLLITALGLILLLVEYALRQHGYKPGHRMYSIYFRPVDSLYNIEGFYADSNGVFCVSQEARAVVARELQTKNTRNELTPYKANQSPEIYSLPEDFMELRDSCFDNEFKYFTENLHLLLSPSDSEFSNAVREYVCSPINSNGFRSIDFKRYTSIRKSVLLLGDSFTWGHSTTNKTNSFADILLAKGYIVYNSGISGTDPAQYLQIAKILIPQLRPDYVVVNFFIGNDILYFNREPMPYMPVFYSTNAGNLLTCPEGVYIMNPKDAYDYTLNSYTIPTESNRFNRFCAKTVLGTLIWSTLARAGLADATLPRFFEYSKKAKEAKTSYPYSDIQIQQIQELSTQYHAKFLLLAIPVLDHGKFVFPQDHKEIFRNLPFHVPDVKPEYYNAVDGHFNDKGNRIYAAFIDSLLRM